MLIQLDIIRSYEFEIMKVSVAPLSSHGTEAGLLNFIRVNRLPESMAHRAWERETINTTTTTAYCP